MFAFFNHAMYANHSLSKQKDCFSRCFNGLLVSLRFKVSFRLVLRFLKTGLSGGTPFLCPNVKFIEISAEKCRREAVLCAEKCIFVRKLYAEKCILAHKLCAEKCILAHKLCAEKCIQTSFLCAGKC